MERDEEGETEAPGGKAGSGVSQCTTLPGSSSPGPPSTSGSFVGSFKSSQQIRKLLAPENGSSFPKAAPFLDHSC